MPGLTFIEELNQLNQSNFLGGLAKAAAAYKEKKQNDIVDTKYQEMKNKLSELTPTEDFIKNVQKTINPLLSATVNDKGITEDITKDITSAVSENTAALAKLLNQKNSISSIYDTYLPIFATLGEKGKEVYGALTSQYNRQIKSIEDIQDFNESALNETKNALGIMSIKLAIANDRNLLQKFAEDKEVNRIYNMLITDFGNDIFTINTKTGHTNIDLKAIQKKASAIYGTGANQQYFAQAFVLFEKFVYENLQSYSPPSSADFTTATNDKLALMSAAVTNYINLADASRERTVLTNGSDALSIATRKAWAEQEGKENPNYDPTNMQVGGNKSMIERITNDVSVTVMENGTRVTRVISASVIREKLMRTYEQFYNKANPYYYYNVVKVFQQQLAGLGAIPAGTQLTPDMTFTIAGTPIRLRDMILNPKHEKVGERTVGGYSKSTNIPGVKLDKNYDNVVQGMIDQKKPPQKSNQYIGFF